VPDAADRPQPIEALAAGVAAAIRGGDLDDGIGTLVGAAVAAVGAQSAMVSLQDPDRPDPELTLTIGLDEAAQAAAVAAVGSPRQSRDRSGAGSGRRCTGRTPRRRRR
jgi:hypothetical protein